MSHVRRERRARQIKLAAFDEERQLVQRQPLRGLLGATRLVFTWAWRSTPERESLVTVTVAKDGDGAMLTLHHEQFFDDMARDGHKHGWTGTLDKLERYLTS